MADASRPDDRFSRIEQIYHQALEQSEKERPAFLAQVCAGDDDLRREVEKLLGFDKKAGSFMESPALDVAAQALARKAAPGERVDFVGRTILHYRVLEKIGEGGMGVVYRALDTHLQRPLAIKVLPPEIVADRERRRRFVQEARAASALNHPNIVHVYDIDRSDGTDFIAMEYVAGKMLGELIPRKGMRLSDALKYSVQIADALAAAHAAGIVHRDLKPANVMVTEKGLVKVLDFGLAKLTESAEKDESGTTETLEPQTEEGTILGTVAYMSPEQAEGKKVDARSDIFSLGSVLYEMVTGQKAFQGTSKMSTLSAILHQEPKPVSAITPTIPADLEKLINRCLRKDPQRRWQTTADLKVALDELKEDSDSGRLQAAPASVRHASPMRLVLVVVAFVVLVAAGWYWLSSQRAAEPEAPMVPVPFTSYPGREIMASFSPDGNQVVFAWSGEKDENLDIYIKYIKQAGGETPRRLTTDPRVDILPRWSPDGQSIAFLRSLDDARTAVLLISPNGGRERQVAELTTLKTAGMLSGGLCWHPSGKYLAVLCDQDAAEAPIGIFLLSPETGEKRLLCVPPKSVLGDDGPAFSPDGRSLAFCRHLSNIAQLYLLRVSQGILPEGEPKQLTFGNQPASSPAWTSDGREIIYVYGKHGTTLWKIPASRKGTPELLPFSGGLVSDPAISPQNRRLIYTLSAQDIDIWRCEIPRAGEHPGPPSKLVATTQTDHEARYSPDGKEIAYVSWSSGTPEIWKCDSDGSNQSQLTHLGGPEPSRPRWSQDSRRIVFDIASGKSVALFLIPAQGGREKQLTQTPYNESEACFSNDGRWIYYTSDRSGENQVWRMAEDGAKPTQITRKGGFHAAVSKDGKTLYYLNGGTTQPDINDLWKVPEEGGEESRVLGGVLRNNFDLTENGIYYATQSAPGVTEFLLHDFADGKTKHIATTQLRVLYGFTVSPDEHWILYTGRPPLRSDLMLVENFR